MHNDTKFGMIITTLTIVSIFSVLNYTDIHIFGMEFDQQRPVIPTQIDSKLTWGEKKDWNVTGGIIKFNNSEPKYPPTFTDLNVKDIDPKKCDDCTLTQYDIINERILQQKIACENNGKKFSIIKQNDEIIQIFCE